MIFFGNFVQIFYDVFYNIICSFVYIILLLFGNIISVMTRNNTSLKFAIIVTLITLSYSKCRFQVKSDNIPFKVDTDPHPLANLNACSEYNGKSGCCDQYNDIQQTKSYQQIDGVFSTKSGGCDLCSINLKRFWCQYACSPNQSNFMQIQDGYFPIPDPQKPGQTIMAQKVTITVEAQTACDLFDSCKRTPFVSSVSALGSPAGFLTFQGHNAVDDAYQYIEVKFSNNKNDSLYFSDDEADKARKALTPCNYTTAADEYHGFPFTGNCSCNTCQKSCNNDEGFQYTDSALFQGFNTVLVCTTWGVVIIVSIIITVARKRWNKQKQH